MTTPILDFVRAYAESNTLRLHMPGHKGAPLLGFEQYDITEISGADSLYEAEGIICESEKNASTLFGCPTYYSTEGSSQCIRAMLYLTTVYAKEKGLDRPLILAGRNVHKTFLSAAALLDLDVDWLFPDAEGGYLSCDISPMRLDAVLSTYHVKPAAVYITSPDYLGNVAYIKHLAEVCRKHGVLLLVDNAHGAYLKFLSPSRHPMDLGADLCCDSAHKTLPVLTGGAYLHISDDAPAFCTEMAKQALSLFGSTSPSYLILQSLDMANAYLASGYAERLAGFVREVSVLRERLSAHGFILVGDEPLKLTVLTKPYGYLGQELAALLGEQGIVCEFADPDHTVFMLTPEVGKDSLTRLEAVLASLPRREAIGLCPPVLTRPRRAMSIREAMLSPSETLPVTECLGRVLAAATVGCPPAVPIVVSGEVIDESSMECFQYYDIKVCSVVKNRKELM